MSSAIVNKKGTCKNGTNEKKLNQFGDFEDVSNMTVGDWEYRWRLQQTKFHLDIVHPMLEKHYDTLLSGKTKVRIFLPLCGKSVDLKWLSDKGHEVVGNEAVDEGCKQFFEEQNIPYETQPIPGIDGVVYKATDGRQITLYRCDFFDLSAKVCGTFDAIWDRGGLVAVPVIQRQEYASVIRDVMKNDCSYVLDAFVVDNEIFGGPPFNCEENDVNMLFRGMCSVKKLFTRDAFTNWQKAWGLTEFTEEIYHMQPK